MATCFRETGEENAALQVFDYVIRQEGGRAWDEPVGTHKIGCFVRQMAQSVVVFFPHGVLMLAKMRGLSLQADENLFHPDGDKLFAANQGLAEQLREMIQVESPTVAQRLEEVDIDYLPMIAP